jgi:hypothetical protein
MSLLFQKSSVICPKNSKNRDSSCDFVMWSRPTEVPMLTYPIGYRATFRNRAINHQIFQRQRHFTNNEIWWCPFILGNSWLYINFSVFIGSRLIFYKSVVVYALRFLFHFWSRSLITAGFHFANTSTLQLKLSPLYSLFSSHPRIYSSRNSYEIHIEFAAKFTEKSTRDASANSFTLSFTSTTTPESIRAM